MRSLLKKILLRNKTDDFSAKRIFSITKYGRENVTEEQLYKEWLRLIKNEIHYRSNEKKMSCFIDLTSDKEIFVNRLLEYLKDKGFCAELLDMKNEKFIYITWNNITL